MKNSMKTLSIVFVVTASLVGTRAHAQVVTANESVKATDVSKSDLRDVFTGGSASLAGSRVTPVLQKSGPAHAAYLAGYVGKTDASLGATWRSLVFAGQASTGYIGKSSPHEGFDRAGVSPGRGAAVSWWNYTCPCVGARLRRL